jgi:hypothetical protein
MGVGEGGFSGSAYAKTFYRFFTEDYADFNGLRIKVIRDNQEENLHPLGLVEYTVFFRVIRGFKNEALLP